jgi:acyl-CoA thioester hydrolase
MIKNGLSYETSREVTTDDIDDLNHVNNAVYVKWMDDVAYAHWSELTREHKLPECIWVVVRHEIDYKAQALLNDKITIRTWVGETSGIKSIRHIAFYKEETLLVQSKTTWVFLDAETQKPTRITESVLKILEAGK